MKHSNFSNYFIICLPSFFSIIEVIIEFNIIHNFFLKDKNLTLYMYVFIEYSASSVIRTSIIRILDYPNPQNNYIHKILMIFMPH